jgi:hypothetical protein
VAKEFPQGPISHVDEARLGKVYESLNRLTSTVLGHVLNIWVLHIHQFACMRGLLKSLHKLIKAVLRLNSLYVNDS